MVSSHAGADGGRLRVAVVDEELPYPANSGKRIRTLNLITRLARRHDITFFAHRSADESEVKPAVEYLVALGVRPVLTDKPLPRKSGVDFGFRLAGNLLSPLPYSVATHANGEMGALIKNATEGAFDLWTYDLQTRQRRQVTRSGNLDERRVRQQVVDST